MLSVERARRDVDHAADALLAFRNGSDEDDPELPWVGALLLAEFLALVRSMGKEPK